MPTVIAHHDVKDSKHWLASPKREGVFGPLGVTNIRTFVDPENPTRVAVHMDVAGKGAVKGGVQDKEIANVVADDGARPVTMFNRIETYVPGGLVKSRHGRQ